jgi:hypothetical protein
MPSASISLNLFACCIPAQSSIGKLSCAAEVQGSLARSLASRFSEGVRVGMVGETTGEPRTASYEDLLLSLLLLHSNGQLVFLHSTVGEDILIAGLDGVGDFPDQVFRHALGLLEDLGCHVEWW